MNLTYNQYCDDKDLFSFMINIEENKEQFKEIESFDFFGFQKLYELLINNKIVLTDLNEVVQQKLLSLNIVGIENYSSTTP
jgi:DNA polymerase III delta subunit